jgi:peptidoglycan/xylan/chitin deacetylase (PgdA/CDA1 family)
MGDVLVTHGLAPEAVATRFNTRFRSEPAAFSRFLAEQKFVTLREALAGQGDALTVDDATRASAEVCRLARSLGHPVTLFVNPGQVESGEPYWFMLLNALFDGLRRSSYRLDGTRYPTTTFRERVKLREVVKGRISVLGEEAARSEAVRQLARRWKVRSLTVPPHAETLRIGDLEDLLARGVELQNHGWWHANHLALSPEESALEVRRGRAWLKERLGVEASYFAVPYGEPLPSPQAAPWCTVWFTLLAPPHGSIGPAVWNRKDVTLYREGNALPEPGPGPRGSLSALAGRAIARLADFFR